ncbi:hypothetical protein Q5P01_005040 [Channa striata]|uniref:SH3 domain-binding glutamic acid-rich-like protein 3 n=1 Tax=Channa striata TaxID=64152 RepID=A0AA88NN10_CHASR|nr:hypothetical protein Q5P01_005040 [Channa striata]
MSLTVYFTSVSSSLKIKKEQDHIMSVLKSKKIPFNAVDISQNPQDKELMREIAGNPTALPPQICKGKKYCGDATGFQEAIEEEKLESFLNL